jgi:hypothetical protein
MDNLTTNNTEHTTQLLDVSPSPQDKAFIRTLQRTYHQIRYPDKRIRIHIDGGANRSVTNDVSILTGYRNIKKYAMNGVSAEGLAIQCTGLGLLPWKATAGETIFIKCYHITN